MSTPPFSSRTAAAHDYLKRGWSPLPLRLGTKKPHQKDWTNLRISESAIDLQFMGRGNVGVLLGVASGDIVVIDLDSPEAIRASRYLPQTECISGHGATPRTHFFYTVSSPVKSRKYLLTRDDCLVELKSTGSHVLVEPSTHPNGDVYQWSEFGDAALIAADEIETLVDLLAAACGLGRIWPNEGSRQEFAESVAGWALRLGYTDADVVLLIKMAAAAAEDPDVDQRVSVVGLASERLRKGEEVYGKTHLLELVGGDESVLDKIEKWLRLDADECAGADVPAHGASDSTGRRPLTDMGNSERLADNHGDDLRFCAELDKWLAWDEARWAIDKTGEVNRRAKATVRTITEEITPACHSKVKKAITNWEKTSESNARLSAMIKVAESDPTFAVAYHDFDSDPWLFNVANGTIDLHTGAITPHDRSHLITKKSSVEFDADATCDQFITFLQRIFEDDANTIAFVQKMVGYSLTGNTSEQCMFLLHGVGANGKSTFIDVVQALLGDYAKQADFNTFAVSRNNAPGGAREDIARLHGARCVAAVEADAGMRLSESIVKQISGGDTVTARNMYTDSIEFKPEFKLVLAANHKPEIRGVDEGIWRRVRFIPFMVTIPAEERDRQLPEKLKTELSGILSWALEGVRLWQEEGLGTCPAVSEATAEYRRESNPLQEFVELLCIRGPQLRITVSEFYASYAEFLSAQGDIPPAKQRVSEALAAMGVQSVRGSGGTRFYTGIALKDLSAMLLHAVPA